MAIKVQIDKASKIKKRLGIEKNGKAQLFLATEATKRMDKYVPKESGVLKDSHDIEPHKITYFQPYARKQFYTNKGKGIRGKKWHLKMLSAEKKMLVKDIENYVKRGIR